MEDVGKEIQWPINNDSIQMLIQYRSLFILKRKFDFFKSDIMTLYSSFESPSTNESLTNHKVIDISGFEPLLNSITLLTNILIISINKPNELYIVDLYNQVDNESKSNAIKHKISVFAREYITLVNEIYFNKRINKPIIEGVKKPIVKGEESNELELAHPIVQYDKKGRVVYSYLQLKEMNNLDYNTKVAKKNKEEIQLDAKNILEKEKLFAETLPLIIADYIHRNPQVVIIDLDRDNCELSIEVRAIFDKEIIKKLAEDLSILKNEIEEMNNESNTKIKKLKEQYDRIINNIELYQRLLIQAEAVDDPNAVYFKEILGKLENEKNIIEAGLSNNSNINRVKSNEMNQFKEQKNKLNGNNQNISILNKEGKTSDSIVTKEERKENAVKEIFFFYANQHNFAGLYPLFESIQKKINNLDLSEFGKFCVEFKIDISKETLVELFKKNSFNRKHLNYMEFKGVLRKIALAMNNTRQVNLSKKIERTKEHLILMMNNNNSELNHFKRKSIFSSFKKYNSTEKIDHNTHRIPPKRASFLFNSKKNQISQELIALEAELTLLNNSTHEHILDKFYNYLGIDTDDSYRKKMKGFIIPFHNKEERNLFWDNQQKELPIIYNKTQDNEITKLKTVQEKQLKVDKQKKIKEDLYYSKVTELKKKNFKLEVHSIYKLKDTTYQNISNKQEIRKKIQIELMHEKNKNKYNWEKIEKLEEFDDLDLVNNKILEDLLYDSDNSDNLEILNNLKTNDHHKKNNQMLEINNIKVIKSHYYDQVLSDKKNTSHKINIDINEKIKKVNPFVCLQQHGKKSQLNERYENELFQKGNQFKNQGNSKIFQKNNGKSSNDNKLITIQNHFCPEHSVENEIVNNKSMILLPNSNHSLEKKEVNFRNRPLITCPANNIHSFSKLNESKRQVYNKNEISFLEKNQDKSTFERLLESRNLQEKQLNREKAKTIQKIVNNSKQPLLILINKNKLLNE